MSIDILAIAEECYRAYDGRETVQTYVDTMEHYYTGAADTSPAHIYASARATDAANLAAHRIPSYYVGAWDAVYQHVLSLALADVRAQGLYYAGIGARAEAIARR